MFGLWRKFRRRKLSRKPYPQHWNTFLEKHVAFYRSLTGKVKTHFETKLKIFVWEKHFTPAGGLEEVTEEMKVVISAAAIRLILYRDLSYYDRLLSIVVYPDHFKHPKEGGAIYGQATRLGSVVLSWRAVLEGLRNPQDGLDTATHEFAHVLDVEDGTFDGTPRLDRSSDYRAWAVIMSKHFLAHQRGARVEGKVMRDYGAQNEVEFFAVATEAFFEKGAKMKRLTPDLYEQLSQFYGCDPAWEFRFVPKPREPGRNDPCHCGGGRKFKRCCGREPG